MINCSDIGLSAVVGDKVTIQNGVFVVNNQSNTYIGVCTVDGFIKLY